MANLNLLVKAILATQKKLGTGDVLAKSDLPEPRQSATIRTKDSELLEKGEGPDPYDSLTEEGVQGLADPKLSLDESIAKELAETELGPTISRREKQELKSKIEPELRKGQQGELFRAKEGEKKHVADRIADKQKLYDATKGQQSYKSIEDPAGERMTLDRILSSEIDESLASRANEAGRVSNQNKSVQKWRDKSQLENLGRSSDEQKILDKANEVTFNINKAVEKRPELSGGQNKYSNTPTTVFNREGPTRIKRRAGEIAKRFGQNEDLNADIQDMYSRLDEMFPGFKKGTPDSDVFFELDAKGKKIPGAMLRGGKDASMASRLADTKKDLANLAQRARMIRNVENPSKSDLQLLARIKAELDKIDNEYFGTKSTQETRQLGNTINPESNVQSLQGIDKDTGEDLLDFVASNRTDAGVEFRQGPTRQKAEQALGPKMSPVLEALKRKQTGFDPRLIGAPYATGADAVPFPYQLRQPTQSTPLMEQIKKEMKPSETMEARGRKSMEQLQEKRKKYEEEMKKMMKKGTK